MIKRSIYRRCFGFLLLLLLTASVVSRGDDVTIENRTVRVVLDPMAGVFSLQEVGSGKIFARFGRLAGETGTWSKRRINDQVFGPGEVLRCESSSGSKTIMVFLRVPFALFRIEMKNTSNAAQVLKRLSLASFEVDLGRPAGALKTLGTGGLLPADKNPGSYAWLAVADPASRNGVVAGWLTHDRASGVLFSTVDKDKVSIEGRSDYGHVQLAAGKSENTETLAIGYFDDARLGLEAWADGVARMYKIKLPEPRSGFCTWYADKYGGSADERHLAELTEFSSRTLKPFGFSFVQIDDGWQLGDAKGNGPRKNFTQFNPQGPYSSGMQKTAADIRAHGLTPGIWFMPFAATYNDPWFEQHTNWFARRADGKPYDNPWGGTSLDMTQPEARDYLRGIIKRIAGEWGYSYFKMDGLYTGIASNARYVNSGYVEDDFGDAVLFDPTKSNVEAFRDGLKLVRETAGPDVFFLGCTVAQTMRTYGASFGLVDAMRIGPDNGGNWKSWLVSPSYGSRHYFLNGRIWYNDPDPNYVRASIPLTDARTMASWAAISGTLNSVSDWLPDLPADRIEILKRTLQVHRCTARPVDLFENDPPRMWLVSDEKKKPRRDVIAVFNWDDKEIPVTVSLSRHGASSTNYAAFDFWANAYLPATNTAIKSVLPAHSCQILAVRPVLDRPFLLSTSRHVTQGMVDVSDENWDGTARALSAKSDVVAEDPYELRLYAPGNWTAAKAEVSPADAAAGVQIKLAQSGPELRVAITSAGSRVVSWRVVFAP